MSLEGFFVGSVATCLATNFTNPMEVVKTRLQLQGEMQELLGETSKKKLGFFQTFSSIVRNEGLLAIQRGLIPAYGYNFCMNGVRFSLYDPLKGYLQAGLSFFTSLDSERQSPMFGINVASGFLSGALGAFFGSPFYLLKVRLQSYCGSTTANDASSQFVSRGHQFGYKTMREAVSSIVSKEGIAGLWRGAASGMLRTGIGSATQLSTYDQVKYNLVSIFSLNSNDLSTHFLASFLTGFVVVSVFNPFDVVNTRLYNQKTDPITGKGTLYSGILDCFIKTCRVEGVRSLYKGFWPHAIRVGPHTILTFIFVEQLRMLLLVQNTDSIE